MTAGEPVITGPGFESPTSGARVWTGEAAEAFGAGYAQGCMDSVIRDRDRKRIKAALPDLVDRHRENLLYTAPEFWGERWAQHLADLSALVDGDQ